jgi:hypothetical protein
MAKVESDICKHPKEGFHDRNVNLSAEALAVDDCERSRVHELATSKDVNLALYSRYCSVEFCVANQLGVGKLFP